MVVFIINFMVQGHTAFTVVVTVNVKEGLLQATKGVYGLGNTEGKSPSIEAGGLKGEDVFGKGCKI